MKKKISIICARSKIENTQHSFNVQFFQSHPIAIKLIVHRKIDGARTPDIKTRTSRTSDYNQHRNITK